MLSTAFCRLQKHVISVLLEYPKANVRILNVKRALRGIINNPVVVNKAVSLLLNC